MRRIPTLVIALLSLAAGLSPAAAATGDAAFGSGSATAGTAIARSVTDRRFGVEINPLMLSESIGRRGRDTSDFDTYLSGTLSVALPGTRNELAMPFAVIDYDANGTDSLDSDFSLRRVDVQLRRYQRSGRGGLYFGPLVRFSRIEGEPCTSDRLFSASGPSTDAPSERVAFSRVGAGVVFGLRGLIELRRLDRHLYWGMNLHLGRWLDDSSTPLNYLYGPMEDHDTNFANVEFAKIGLRF